MIDLPELQMSISLPHGVDAADPMLLDKLIASLRTDLKAAEVHTDVLVFAGRWVEGNRHPSLLLRGQQLRRTQSWAEEMGRRDPRWLPRVTALQREFIEASQARQTWRRLWGSAATICSSRSPRPPASFTTVANKQRRRRPFRRGRNPAAGKRVSQCRRYQPTLNWRRTALSAHCSRPTSMKPSMLRAKCSSSQPHANWNTTMRRDMRSWAAPDELVAIGRGTKPGTTIIDVWNSCNRSTENPTRDPGGSPYHPTHGAEVTGEITAVAASQTGKIVTSGPGASLTLFEARANYSPNCGQIQLAKSFDRIRSFYAPNQNRVATGVAITRDAYPVAATLSTGETHVWDVESSSIVWYATRERSCHTGDIQWHGRPSSHCREQSARASGCGKCSGPGEA